MKQRRIYRRGMARTAKIKWGIVVTVCIMMAGVSYAAHTNVLTNIYYVSTGNMSFIFDQDKKQNVIVQMQNGTNGKINKLDATVSYEDKKLYIKNIGPIDMKDLSQGNAILTIQYVLMPEKEGDGIRLPAAVVSDKDQGYDLGTVDFNILSETPIWNINNNRNSWGTASGDISRTPDMIYRYMPDSLGEFHVYNTLQPDSKKGIVVGTLKMIQTSCPDLPEDPELSLKSLDLSEQIVNEIKSGAQNTTLEIQGSYGFSIPLNLDQFNMER